VTDLPDTAELEAQVSLDLVARIRRGDRAAEEAMVRRYATGLLYLLKRRARDPELALDIRQDTFRIAIEKLRAAEIEEPERLGAYLRGIALNLVLADSRKQARRATSPDSARIDAAADEASGPYEHASRADAQKAVKALLQQLRVPRDREILIRTYLMEEDKDSICAALEIDSTHFNRVLFRAKQRFKELLSGRDGSDLRLVK
jgi:RNA polymerase sigma-70 factor, ECF subfamily